jgi:hypothetical protein
MTEELPPFPDRLWSNGQSGDGKELYISNDSDEWSELSLDNDDVTIGQKPFRDEIIKRYNAYGEMSKRLVEQGKEDPRCTRCGCRGTIWDDGVCHGCHLELTIDGMRAALSRLVDQAELTTDYEESYGGTLHDAIRQARAVLKG